MDVAEGEGGFCGAGKDAAGKWFREGGEVGDAVPGDFADEDGRAKGVEDGPGAVGAECGEYADRDEGARGDGRRGVPWAVERELCVDLEGGEGGFGVGVGHGGIVARIPVGQYKNSGSHREHRGHREMSMPQRSQRKKSSWGERVRAGLAGTDSRPTHCREPSDK